MLLTIPGVLTKEQVSAIRAKLDTADWIDGRQTAGAQAVLVKDNLQLSVNDPLAQSLGDDILAALSRNPLFISAALPHRVLPPMFNHYTGGGSFGNHIDNAIRNVPGTPVQLRSDLSATLFLSEPVEYDGGELIVEHNFGTQSIKLPAGDLVVYPASSLHRVMPVTRGARISSFFWIQSMIRSDQHRTLLFELDNAIQSISQETPGHPSAVKLTGVYHNLVRLWSEI